MTLDYLAAPDGMKSVRRRKYEGPLRLRSLSDGEWAARELHRLTEENISFSRDLEWWYANYNEVIAALRAAGPAEERKA